MITTIMVYEFERLSCREVETMLEITLQETGVYREIREEGREFMAHAILRQLTKRLGSLPDETHSRITGIPLLQLEYLSKDLMDFASVDDSERSRGKFLK